MMRLAVSLLIALLSLPASAATIVFSGSFSASDSTPDPGVPSSISGTWASQPFNNSVVPPSGDSNFTVSLASLSFTPSPYSGSYSFSTSDTAVQVFYKNGVLNAIVLGATLAGVSSLVSGTNDFVVSHLANGSLSTVAWSAVGGAVNIADATSGQAAATPEPALLPWLALAALRSLRRQSLGR